eukprot:6202755-Pleurochrysis_carterae.AAC.2
MRDVSSSKSPSAAGSSIRGIRLLSFVVVSGSDKCSKFGRCFDVAEGRDAATARLCVSVGARGKRCASASEGAATRATTHAA